jgi:hypothetical protein
MVWTWDNIRLFFMSHVQLRNRIAILEEENAELRRQLNLPASTTEGKQCPICLEDLNTGWLARTPCWHIYHIQCALQFMKYRRECPVCRERLEGCSKIFVRDDRDNRDNRDNNGPSTNCLRNI